MGERVSIRFRIIYFWLLLVIYTRNKFQLNIVYQKTDKCENEEVTRGFMWKRMMKVHTRKFISRPLQLLQLHFI